MRVLVCVKHVPVDVSQAAFDATFATDRGNVPGHLGAADRAALEAARALGADEVVAVTMGPASARGSLAQARALGADRLLHVVDSALAGSDAAGTSLVLAAVAREVGADLVVLGAASDDGGSGFVPAQVASRLAWPLLGRVGELLLVEADDGAHLRGRRVAEGGTLLEAPLPAVVSVLPGDATEQTDGASGPGADDGSGRAPTARPEPGGNSEPGPVRVIGLRELGIEPVAVGRANAWTRIEAVMPLEVEA